MMPILFKGWFSSLGIAGVPAFFFMIMVATLVATYFAVRFARQDGRSEVVVLDMAIIAVVASMLGARIFHVLVEAPDYYGIWPWDPSLFVRVFYFWQGGFVSLGAFIATIGGWILYFKWRKQPMLPYLDIMARVVPFILFFVRLGCLLAGCCYGRPTDFFIHLTFTDPNSTAYHFYPNIPLHASQIYFQISAIVLFFFMQWRHRYQTFHGQMVAIFLMYYGLSRFLIEFLRGDEDRGMYFNGLVSTGQVVMIGFFVAGVLVYRWCQKRYPVA
ncbi:MAG: hypothetical protein COV45_03480 [Deltaproteobacteria bacterium CG11_big_fil_rev_8_21_14_0_20_47_16]|nr:MAG: hypothetical protein COV45_03480 [Deltaproteobacteria bacterium CG11_big_fil_rev_8_21_14_0_20_47_16]